MSVVRRSAHRNEDGMSIVGVVIAALIIMIALIPAASLLEASLAVSANNQHRVVASNLATQQLETVRNQIAQDTFFAWVQNNGLPVTSVTTTNPVTLAPVSQTVGSITYNVATTIRWSAAGDFSTGGCSSITPTSSQIAPVLQVAIAVTWPNERLAQPVTLAANINAPSSIISTANGSVLFSVIGAGGSSDPQNLAVVHLINTTTQADLSGSTDATGCAFFANVSPGTYTAEIYANAFENTGFVNQAAQPEITDPITVVAGKTSAVQFVFDKAATFSVSDPAQSTIAPEFGLVASDSYLSGTPGISPLQLTPSGSPATYGPVFPNSAGYETWLSACPASQFTPANAYQTAVSTSPGQTSGINGLNYSTLDLTLLSSATNTPLPQGITADIYVWQYGSITSTSACNLNAIIIPVTTTNNQGQATLNVPTGYFALAGALPSDQAPSSPSTSVFDATTPQSVGGSVLAPSVSVS